MVCSLSHYHRYLRSFLECFLSHSYLGNYLGNFFGLGFWSLIEDGLDNWSLNCHPPSICANGDSSSSSIFLVSLMLCICFAIMGFWFSLPVAAEFVDWNCFEGPKKLSTTLGLKGHIPVPRKPPSIFDLLSTLYSPRLIHIARICFVGGRLGCRMTHVSLYRLNARL